MQFRSYKNSFMPKPRNDARLSPCEAFWQKHNGFLCEKPILPYEHSAKQTNKIFSLLHFFCFIINKFSSIDVDTSIIVNNKLNEVWYDALVRGIGCGILIYTAVECFKQFKNPLVVIMPVMGFIICGFDHCIANYAYMVMNGVYWSNNMICWVIGNLIGSLMIYRIET